MHRRLKQEDIDALLRDYLYDVPVFKDIGEFEDFLTKRKFKPEEKYGLFENDVTVIRFFNDSRGDSILADIVSKNKEESMGNIQIPETSIQLVNYSKCPRCDTVYSFGDLWRYYKNPAFDPFFRNKDEQFREDTRMRCNCGQYFLPSLVIVDGTPKNEVQFLCRVQTADAIEKWYAIANGKAVLSRNRQNFMVEEGKRALRNDVSLKELAEKPGLVSNLIQYTPVDLVMYMIKGENLERRDPLFGEWRSRS